MHNLSSFMHELLFMNRSRPITIGLKHNYYHIKHARNHVTVIIARAHINFCGNNAGSYEFIPSLDEKCWEKLQTSFKLIR